MDEETVESPENITDKTSKEVQTKAENVNVKQELIIKTEVKEEIDWNLVENNEEFDVKHTSMVKVEIKEETDWSLIVHDSSSSSVDAERQQGIKREIKDENNCAFVFKEESQISDAKQETINEQGLTYMQNNASQFELCRQNVPGNKENHQITRIDEKTFKCIKCEKIFKTKDKSTRHERRTNLEERPFRCHLCGNAFTLKSQLK